jgi:glycosyltransferase involved in cell wall biosynthesis
MPEVLRDGGVYFNPEDPESIFSAIKILIEDKELRNIVAENAFIYSQEFSWERCSHETLGLLTETIRNFYRNE